MSSIKIRSLLVEETTEIRILIEHPMENGRNRDPSSGELIAAHFIQELMIQLNEVPILNINMAGSMAKNPYFSFRLKHIASGQIIMVSWTDNRQLSDSAEHVIL